MAYEIPLTRSEYVVEDATIPGNSKAQIPVKFFLSPAAGPDLARLKSVMLATYNLTFDAGWTEEIQGAVIRAFQNGQDLFIRTVEKIEGLTVPGWLAKKVLLIPTDKHDQFPDGTQFPIRNGLEYSIIAGYVPALSFLVACEIGKISGAVNKMDGRFFGPPSGSSGTATANQEASTTAPAAPKRRAKRGTAARK